MSTTLPTVEHNIAAPQQPCTPASTDEKRKKLPAEALFDASVYTGISFFAQAVTSLFLTRWVRYGGGKDGYRSAVDGLMKNFTHDHSPQNLDRLFNKWDSTILTNVMIGVGTLFVPPVKFLEDRKGRCVRWINDKVVERVRPPRTVEDQECTEKALQDMEELGPKQSWGSLVLSRFAALVPVWTVLTALGPKGNTFLEKKAADAVSHAFSRSGVPGLERIAHSEATQHWTRLAFIESFYSAISAGSIYTFSRIFGARKQRAELAAAAENTAMTVDPMNAPAPSQDDKAQERTNAPKALMHAADITANASMHHAMPGVAL